MAHDYVLHEERIGDVSLKIVPDPEPVNPRTEWHNAATMACWHRRYRLGDTIGPTALADAIRACRDYRDTWERFDCANDGSLDLFDPGDISAVLPKCRDIIRLPLYLYDHSGITISTGRFACPWDSGQVGYVFMTKAQVLAELGKPGATRLSPRLRDRATALMRAEVANYDRYLTGDVWGYIVEDDDGAQIDSCWGIFGYACCIEDGRSTARWVAAQRERARATAFAEEAEQARPDMYRTQMR